MFLYLSTERIIDFGPQLTYVPLSIQSYKPDFLTIPRLEA